MSRRHRDKASTITFYTGHLETHVLPALGDRPVAAIRRQDCRDLIDACRTKGLRVTTVRGVLRALSTVLSQAVEDQLLPANPAVRMGRYLRQGDEPEPVVDSFTRDETAHLVTVGHTRFPDWYPWVLCALRAGMRAGELLAVQWGDIDWGRGCIEVQRNLVRGLLTTPKNHQRRRVDLSAQLQVVLQLWRRQQRPLWLKVGRPFPEWL